MDLCPYLFCFFFYLLYFVLPPFRDNGLPFLVTGVLCQHSEVVFWNLFSVQMFFQWICGEESGLPILFLCHLRTTSMCDSNSTWKVSCSTPPSWASHRYQSTTVTYLFLWDFNNSFGIWIIGLSESSTKLESPGRGINFLTAFFGTLVP